jgi:peptide/nickel transport system permease protein
MSGYILKRLLWTVPVLLAASTLVFVILQLVPGDPVNLMLAGRPASDEVRENLRKRLGLDRPVAEQYVRFVVRAARGDFGESFRTRQAVTSEIAAQLPSTLHLATGGLLLGTTGGVTLGVIAGLHPNSLLGSAVMLVALIGVSIPVYWVAMLLIYVFGLKLGWVPIVGMGWQSLILPSIAVGLWPIGDIARLLRSAIIEVMSEEYIRTAYAKGLPRRAVVVRHALRNSLIPAVTIVGLQLGVLVSGGIIVEMVFARRGIGTLLVEAILEKDYPVTQTLIILTTLAFVVANLLVDIAYALLDPRIRYE